MDRSTKRFWFPLIGGLLLILAGVMLLLESLNLVALNWDMLIGPLFFIGGLIFILRYLTNRGEWWPLIPGLVLMALGLIIFFDQSAFADQWSGLIFLGFLGIAFWLIYFLHRENWWAIIPAGTLTTLAVVSALPDEGVLISGGAFFLGLAITFGLVYLSSPSEKRLTWALYPAAVLFALGIVVSLGASNYLNYIWPIGLLAVGVVLIFQSIRRR